MAQGVEGEEGGLQSVRLRCLIGLDLSPQLARGERSARARSRLRSNGCRRSRLANGIKFILSGWLCGALPAHRMRNDLICEVLYKKDS